MTAADQSENIFAQCRQGDVFVISGAPAICDISEINGTGTDKLVIISQTCDVVRQNRRKIVLAPLVLLDSVAASNARRGNQSQYIPLDLPEIGENCFANLTSLVTLDKDLLSQATFVCHGVLAEDLSAIKKFANSVARRFNRFPVPDDLVPWVSPLQVLVRKNSQKNNPIRTAIDTLVDLRMSADHWFKENRRLVLFLILPTRELVAFEDLDPAWSIERMVGVKNLESFTNLNLFDTCALLESNFDSSSRSQIWRQISQLLCNEIATQKDSGLTEAQSNAVISVEVELYNEDEFSLRMLQNSESLDLEDLSY